jgi:hypothetical protein
MRFVTGPGIIPGSLKFHRQVGWPGGWFLAMAGVDHYRAGGVSGSARIEKRTQELKNTRYGHWSRNAHISLPGAAHCQEKYSRRPSFLPIRCWNTAQN